MAGIVPTISVERADDVVPVCHALAEAGVPVGEITLRTDASMDALALGRREVPDFSLGVGTLLTVDQVRRAEEVGAAFFVTPGASPQIMEYCAARGLPLVPGCSTGGEIQLARSFGHKVVKFFPVEQLGGLDALKALSGPYGDVGYVPMGGIDDSNIGKYIAFGKVVACGGSWIVPKKLIQNRDFEGIADRARASLAAMFAIRLAHVGINSDGPDTAADAAAEIAALLGKPVVQGNSSVFVGSEVEVVKANGRGARGHIGFGCLTLDRLRWHLERKGYAFDEESAKYENGRLKVIYLRDEIASFAIHFIQD